MHLSAVGSKVTRYIDSLMSHYSVLMLTVLTLSEPPKYPGSTGPREKGR